MEPNKVNVINYREVAQAVKEKTAERPDLSHREAIKEFVSERTAAVPIPSPQTRPTVQTQPQNDGRLPPYAQSAPADKKSVIERLITLTLQKGLNEGISYAKREDPYVLDAYHDALTDVLHDELKKQNLI